MKSEMFSLDELCQLADYPKRTVRYYIQLGLVSRPVGEARAARYTGEHLNQLRRIKQLTISGVSLRRVAEILAGAELSVPLIQRRPGDVEIRNHVHVAPGLEFQIIPSLALLTPEQMRRFIKGVIKLVNAAQDE